MINKGLGKSFLVGSACLAAIILVSGCSSIKRTLGFEKAPPDEFSVVKKAPLTLPPDFSLRPPLEKDPNRQSAESRDAAEVAMTGKVFAEDRLKSAGVRPGDKSVAKMLSKARGTKVVQSDMANIKKTVNEEAGVYDDKDEKSIMQKVLFWQEKKKPTEKILDPIKESDKLALKDEAAEVAAE